ncbi:hypothetical protein ACIQ1J_22420 [Streptomyces sp. NPDC097107]|uniref:hypothetical protein n=1 Tax=Streptomyces sp. NPDC097107 TaxID=3366089 RepID=UPI00381C0BF2
MPLSASLARGVAPTAPGTLHARTVTGEPPVDLDAAVAPVEASPPSRSRYEPTVHMPRRTPRDSYK